MSEGEFMIFTDGDPYKMVNMLLLASPYWRINMLLLTANYEITVAQYILLLLIWISWF